MSRTTSLALPPGPAPTPEALQSDDPSLSHAAPARGRPFRLAGRRAVVTGIDTRGITASQGDGQLLTGPVTLEKGPGANVVLAPRFLRRELPAHGASLQELVLVPAALPGFAVQWTARSGSGPWSARLEVQLPGTPGGGSRWNAEAGILRVAGGEGDDAGCLLALSPAGPWQVTEEGVIRRARVELAVPEDEPLTLLVAAVDGTGALPSLASLAALEAHRRRLEVELRDAPGIRLTTGVAELDRTVAWSRAALRAAVGPEAPPSEGPAPGGAPELAELLMPSARRGWAVMGALAAGEHDVARALLDQGCDTPTEIAAAAHWMAWTGDAGTLRARALTAPPSPSPSAGRGVRLPTVSSPSPASGLVAAVLGDPGAGGPAPTTAPWSWAKAESPAEALLLARAHYAWGDAHGGFRLLRPALSALLADGPPLDATLPALAMWALVTGLLGARPDAPVGRLRLAPALPGSWTGFALEGLRVGDSVLDLEYRRSGSGHLWRFRPTAGAVPLMLVLEPLIAVDGVDRVEVDGAAADVDITDAAPGYTRIRLQLPLDTERSLAVEAR